jgi:uncharacterized protein YciI
MFVVILTYTQPLEKLEKFTAAHRQFLATHYASGVLLASGPQIPRTGGVIIARGVTREALQALLADDPFSRESLATYQIIEFQARACAPEISSWIEQPR